MTEKILLVDDESHAFTDYKRQLNGRFKIEIAESGQEGLNVLERQGPFAVVVSNRRMLDIDGAQFLSAVKKRAPDTVRIILAERADLETVVQAVNAGNVFRFLAKPCSSETLTGALEAGIKQYRLIKFEKESHKKALLGVVDALVEILSLVNPAAFKKSLRVSQIVSHVAIRMNLSDLGQIQLAGILSQIGCVALPPDLLEKNYNREEITRGEMNMFSTHPHVASALLKKIPQFENIARMIERQQQPLKSGKGKAALQDDYLVDVGAQILNVALAYDYLAARDVSHEIALSMIRKQKNDCTPEIFDALKDYRLDKTKIKEESIKCRECA